MGADIAAPTGWALWAARCVKAAMEVDIAWSTGWAQCAACYVKVVERNVASRLLGFAHLEMSCWSGCAGLTVPRCLRAPSSVAEERMSADDSERRIASPLLC